MGFRVEGCRSSANSAAAAPPKSAPCYEVIRISTETGLHEPQSKLQVSPLITPGIIPYSIPHICKRFGLGFRVQGTGEILLSGNSGKQVQKILLRVFTPKKENHQTNMYVYYVGIARGETAPEVSNMLRNFRSPLKGLHNDIWFYREI